MRVLEWIGRNVEWLLMKAVYVIGVTFIAAGWVFSIIGAICMEWSNGNEH